MNDSILLDIKSPVAYITLNKSSSRHSLNNDDIHLFHSILDQIEGNDEIRFIVLSSSETAVFCAGASFEHVKDLSLRGDILSPLAERLLKSKLLSVCLLNGSVYGGGVELSLACDFRLGLESNMLHVPISQLGLSYSAFGLKLYHSKLGLQLSKRILVTAEKIDAKTLLSQGFYDYLFTDEDAARDFISSFIQRVSALAPLAVVGMKQALNTISIGDFDQEHYEKHVDLCVDSRDRKEGFKALLERRAPVFKGH